MWFWIIVLAVFLVVLALAWRSDRRRGVRRGGVSSPDQDATVGEARAEVVKRNISGMGGGRI